MRVLGLWVALSVITVPASFPGSLRSPKAEGKDERSEERPDHRRRREPGGYKVDNVTLRDFKDIPAHVLEDYISPTALMAALRA